MFSRAKVSNIIITPTHCWYRRCCWCLHQHYSLNKPLHTKVALWQKPHCLNMNFKDRLGTMYNATKSNASDFAYIDIITGIAIGINSGTDNSTDRGSLLQQYWNCDKANYQTNDVDDASCATTRWLLPTMQPCTLIGTILKSNYKSQLLLPSTTKMIETSHTLIWLANVNVNADITVTILHQDNNKIKSDVSSDYSPRAIFQLQQCQNRYDSKDGQSDWRRDRQRQRQR